MVENNCPCNRPQSVTLIDGATCCTWCERYRAECEARHILAMPTKQQRLDYLHGVTITETGYDGKPRQKIIRRGALQVRGESATHELEKLIISIYNKK